MKSRDFCYWLQGFFEISPTSDKKDLNERQVNLIQQHLALVFKHEIDPQAGSTEHQAQLNEIHTQPVQQFGGVTADNILFRC